MQAPGVPRILASYLAASYVAGTSLNLVVHLHETGSESDNHAFSVEVLLPAP